MYRNHSDISLLELKHQYFTGWLFVERLKGWKGLLCSALFCFTFSLCSGNEKHTSLSPCPCQFAVLFYSSYPRICFIRCSLSFCFPISPPPPLPFSPLSLSISYIHLKSSSFPGGENLIYLLCCTHTVRVYLCLLYIVRLLVCV